MITAPDINFGYDQPVTQKSSWGGKRPGAGRKPILRDRVGFTVHVDGEQYDQLTELAEEKEQSLGSVVREAITAYLTRKRKRR